MFGWFGKMGPTFFPMIQMKTRERPQNVEAMWHQRTGRQMGRNYCMTAIIEQGQVGQGGDTFVDGTFTERSGLPLTGTPRVQTPEVKSDRALWIHNRSCKFQTGLVEVRHSALVFFGLLFEAKLELRPSADSWIDLLTSGRRQREHSITNQTAAETLNAAAREKKKTVEGDDDDGWRKVKFVGWVKGDLEGQ